ERLAGAQAFAARRDRAPGDRHSLLDEARVWAVKNDEADVDDVRLVVEWSFPEIASQPWFKLDSLVRDLSLVGSHRLGQMLQLSQFFRQLPGDLAKWSAKAQLPPPRLLEVSAQMGIDVAEFAVYVNSVVGQQPFNLDRLVAQYPAWTNRQRQRLGLPANASLATADDYLRRLRPRPQSLKSLSQVPEADLARSIDLDALRNHVHAQVVRQWGGQLGLTAEQVTQDLRTRPWY